MVNLDECGDRFPWVCDVTYDMDGTQSIMPVGVGPMLEAKSRRYFVCVLVL